MSEVTPPAQKATRREWIGLAVIALPCILYSMDLTVLNLAVPEISAQLKPSASQLLWIVDIYGFMVAGSLITMGTLGDRIGRRRILMYGSVAFGLASIFAAFAWSAESLIVARAVLGVAAATLAPSTLSLIRNMFLDDKERTLAIGIWIACFSAGGAIGPVIGGLMLSAFWWGSVFLLAVPVMVLLLVLGPMLLPEFRDPNAGRIDLVSAGQSLVAILLMIYGMKHVAEDGISVLAVGVILAGLGIGLLFIMRQRRLADPLIDLSLFSCPSFSAALSINIVGLFIAFGAFLFVAQYLQLVLGLTPFEAGLWSLPSSLMMVLGSVAIPSIAQRYSASTLIGAGFICTALGLAICTQASTSGSPLIVVIGLVVMSMGFAPVGTLTTEMVVGSAPPERAGAASAISETSFEFGGALGVAVLGSLLTASYRSRMEEVSLKGLSTEALDAARQTLGGAVSASASLSAVESERLLETARTVFTDAFTLTSGVCAAIALITAAAAISVLRRAGGGGTRSTAPAH
jgi:DHA2 family multidrug resistance protein-like MFS transporter